MTEIAFDILLKQLAINYFAKKKKQIDLQHDHEESENFGMAYLALWAIVEDFAVRLGPICQRVELRCSLEKWLTFLNGQSSVAPRIITAGKFDLASEVAARIPSENLLTTVIALEVAPNFYELLDSKKKYRKRRNSVAHSGEIVSGEVYGDFKKKIFRGLTEIEGWLSALAVREVE